MPTVNDLIAAGEQRRRDAERRVSAAERAAKNVMNIAAADGRSTLSSQEDARIEELIADKRAAADEVKRVDGELAGFRKIAAEDAESDRQSRVLIPTGVRSLRSGPATSGLFRVGQEERTYRPDYREYGGPSFIADVYKSQLRNDPGANERLARHGREIESNDPNWQQRAIGTGAVAGLVPPSYLTDLWAELARAGRPVANLCTRLPLPPDGMSVNFSRITTGSTTAIQATENAAVSETNADDTLLSTPVCTVAGQQTVSRQALERGVLVEEVLWADLGAAYNAALDTQVINGSGSSGQHLGLLGVSGINSVTYTDASPTVPELYPKLADSFRQVVSQRYTGPTAWVMRPQEWGWICAALGTDNRPLIDVGTGLGQNVLATSGAPEYGGIAGRLFGVPVYLSGNIPANLGGGTNETRIITADFRDVLLFEDNGGAPVQLRCEQPSAASLSVLLVLYGYSALASGRQPKAISVLSGTGLIPQSL